MIYTKYTGHADCYYTADDNKIGITGKWFALFNEILTRKNTNLIGPCFC